MSLANELGLKKHFATVAHEAMLNIYFTGTAIKKEALKFLEPYNLTEVQLNLLMIIHYQSGKDGGLSQAQISSMMLVNRANITSLIDRMERVGLVSRTASAEDRRYNIVRLTAKARRILKRVEPAYGEQVSQIMSVLSKTEQKKLIEMLEKVRTKFRSNA